MIKQKYALQYIDQRNCDFTNIFFNSDRKLFCLNFNNLQLSILFTVFVTKIQNNYELNEETKIFGIELPCDGMDITGHFWLPWKPQFVSETVLN